MYLAPYKLSGKNLCPHASKGCVASCLFTAGRGRYRKIQLARIKKTRFFIEDRAAFMAQLENDISNFDRYCKKRGKKAAIRLNGTSDLAWERLVPKLFARYPDVQFYDYTKSATRMHNFLDGKLPPNYHLTFSRSEVNESKCLEILNKGGNVSIVTNGPLDNWHGFPTYDSDKTDLRFLDPFGVGVLKMKGRARHDRTGFVLDTISIANPVPISA